MSDAEGTGTTSAAVDTLATATANGTGPAITIVLGSEAVKPFAWFAGSVLAVILLVSIAAISFGIYAAVKVDAYTVDIQSRMRTLETEARLQSYWAERAEVAMTAAGVKVPPVPKSATANRKKE